MIFVVYHSIIAANQTEFGHQVTTKHGDYD
jgi:hypothetical protein